MVQEYSVHTSRDSSYKHIKRIKYFHRADRLDTSSYPSLMVPINVNMLDDGFFVMDRAAQPEESHLGLAELDCVDPGLYLHSGSPVLTHWCNQHSCFVQSFCTFRLKSWKSFW